MAYKLLVNVFLNGAEQPAGSVHEINDEALAQRLVERGSVESTDESVTVKEQAATEAPAPDAPLSQENANLTGTDTPTPEQLAQDFEQTGASGSTPPSSVNLS